MVRNISYSYPPLVARRGGEVLDIDFEKILPTPECLEGPDSHTEHSLYYYLMTTGKEDMVDKWLSYPQLLSMDIYKDKTEEELSDYKIRGEEIFNIALQYGAIDWYDWRITNWGTKWNAYDTEMDSCDGSAELYFNTANHGAVPLIKKLVEMFPDLEFSYSYADEVIANNCGEGYGVDGSISFKFPEDESDEAMELYIECWRADWDDFKKNEYGWCYK
jgi:hypothetical protein